MGATDSRAYFYIMIYYVLACALYLGCITYLGGGGTNREDPRVYIWTLLVKFGNFDSAKGSWLVCDSSSMGGVSLNKSVLLMQALGTQWHRGCS